MPTNDSPKIHQINIKSNGTNIPDVTYDQLIRVEVDTSLGMPDSFIAQFHDDKFTIVDAATFALGTEIIISLPNTTGTLVQAFKGEVIALEPEFTSDNQVILTVRGYDKTHRLSRATKIRTFLNSKDSDAVNSIVQENGLTTDVTTTSEVHKHIFQDNCTDLEFLQQIAYRNGFAIKLSEGKVVMKAPSDLGTTTVSVTWGVQLREFRPRASLAQQVTQVTVKGWNVQTKQAIVGQSTTSTSHPTIGLGKSGISASQSLGAAIHTSTNHVLASQAQATTIAKAILDDINGEFIQAEGICFGNVAIKAGMKLSVQKVGTKFSGTYFVTSALHIYSREGYDTHVKIEGDRTFIAADFVGHSATPKGSNRWSGVYVAVVTNLNDDDDQGRVKIKYPWLDDAKESFWARVATPKGGATHGIMFMPEVNDEVLVAFEQGNFNRPIIIGALWNGTDKPPFAKSLYLKNGKVALTGIKTRLGSQLKFTEEDSKKLIEIIDSGSTLKITMDTTNKKIIIESDTGGLELKSSGKIIIDAQQDVEIKGVNIKSTASSAIEMTGSGSAKLESSGTTVVKGSMVNIN